MEVALLDILGNPDYEKEIYDFSRGSRELAEKENDKRITPLDKVMGGAGEVVRRQALSAPLANPALTIPMQREMVNIRRSQRSQRLMDGTRNSYARMEREREKRRALSYKPMPRWAGMPKVDRGVQPGEYDIPDRVGTAGESNIIETVVPTGFKDYDVVVGRGTLGNEPGKAKPFFF